jgi:hypothetical protein
MMNCVTDTRWRRFAYPAVIMVLIVAGGCAKEAKPPAAADTPTSAVKTFYDWRIHSRMTGLPTPSQLTGMAPYVSKALYAALEQERTRNPGFTEGDLFSSLFDGPTSFRLGKAESRGNEEYIVPVRFFSGRQLPAVNWVDHVKVVREGDAFVVADVEFGNHWNFGDDGTLTKALQQGLPDHAEHKATAVESEKRSANAP